MPTKLELIEKQMPVLPGYAVRKHRPSYHKAHFCDFADGVRVVHKEIAKHEPKPADAKQEHTAPPDWMALDKKVLRFYGCFTDVTAKTAADALRRVIVLFYLEDGTIQVSERRAQDSGTAHIQLVRRHHLHGQTLTLHDFNVGKTMTVYAKDISLQACDKFTRNYLTEAGVTVPGDQIDVGTVFADVKRVDVPKKSPSFVVSQSPNRSFKKFFQHDGQVLRFYCVWDDHSAAVAGEYHQVVLHYFLADDTIEVRQQVGATGVNTVPLVRRHRIPKGAVNYSMDGSNLAPPTAEAQNALFYSVRDLVLGKVITVYGKTIALCECDAFTRSYFADKLGVQVVSVSRARYGGFDTATDTVVLKQPQQTVAETHTSDWDEVGSLPGSAPPKEPRKKGVDEKIVLRFAAVLKAAAGSALDQQRKFVISYFYVDNTFAVYENRLLNSGLPGGKFLDRTQIKKPGSRVNYSSKDLEVGAELTFFGRTFILRALDSATAPYVSQYPALFPKLV